MLHGTFGEDGRLQGMLDWMGIPYTGEGLRSSLLGFDKGLAKLLYRQASVPVASDVLVSASQVSSFSAEDVPFNFPVVAKPVAQGSSVGVVLVQAPDQFRAALDSVGGGDVLIEAFVEVRKPPLSFLATTHSAALKSLEAFVLITRQSMGTRGHGITFLHVGVEDIAEAERIGLAAHHALGCRSSREPMSFRS